jgi:hypothetical protein
MIWARAWAALRWLARAAWWLVCAATYLARCAIIVLVAVLFGYRYGSR